MNRMVPGADRDRVIGLLEGSERKWDEVEWNEEEWRGVGFRCEYRDGRSGSECWELEATY